MMLGPPSTRNKTHGQTHVSKTNNVGLDFPTSKVAGRLALPTPWKPTKVLRQIPQALGKTPVVQEHEMVWAQWTQRHWASFGAHQTCLDQIGQQITHDSAEHT